MARLFGREYARGDLLRRVGDISQVAGVDWLELQDGPERGVRLLHVRTGSGLAFDVLADRGMDLGRLEYRGAALAWRSPSGFTSPWLYEASDYGLLRYFHGGMLVTCGLVSMGPPSVDEGKHYPMHGRASNTPAREVRFGGDWEGDEYRIWVEGKVRETQLFGENVELTRRVTTSLGSDSLEIHDVVRNLGYAPEPIMMLYHMNFGFPIVDAETVIQFGRRDTVRPRDEAARLGEAVHDRGAAPAPGFREQVFHHDPEPDERGNVTVLLANPAFAGGRGLGARLIYAKRTLPYLWQWRMLGEGTYVVGIEPANGNLFGRAAARREGSLDVLRPGEERQFDLRLEVLGSNEEIDRARAEV